VGTGAMHATSTILGAACKRVCDEGGEKVVYLSSHAFSLRTCLGRFVGLFGDWLKGHMDKIDRH